MGFLWPPSSSSSAMLLAAPPDLRPAPPPSASSFDPLAASFRPSIAVIIGVLTTMFSLTFLLLLYAKHCKRTGVGIFAAAAAASASPDQQLLQPPPPLRGRNSGVDRALVEALPLFSFASLHGLKDGLECAVCLCRFEKPDTLRLLPKCKHAFHLECVDTWLENHSTCPLCRHKVEAEDVLMVEEFFTGFAGAKGAAEERTNAQQQQQQTPRNSTGGDFASAARNSGEVGIERMQQLFVQRESELESSPSVKMGRDSSRKEGAFTRSGSARKDHGGSGRKDSLLLADSLSLENDEQLARRLGHRIIVSDVVFQHRWSDFMASDVLFLSSHKLFGQSERLSASRKIDASNVDLPGLSSPKPEPPRLSAYSRNEPAPLSHSRIDDAGSPRLSVSKSQKPRISTSSSSSDVGPSTISNAAATTADLEMGSTDQWSAPRHSSSSRLSPIKGTRAEGETKSAFERQASLLKRALTIGRQDGDARPSYQRSKSEVTGMGRYADMEKVGVEEGSEGDEKARRWFSIARKTISWWKGSERSKATGEGGQPLTNW